MAEVDERVVGAACIATAPHASTWDVQIVAVEDAMWQAGVGLALVRTLLDHLRNTDSDTVEDGAITSAKEALSEDPDP